MSNTASIPEQYISFDWFYTDQLGEDLEVLLRDDDHRHLYKSLRKKIGDTIVLCDGRGGIAFAKINHIDKKQATLQSYDFQIIECNQPDIELFVGLTAKSSRNEWMLEKVTELGVKSIFFLNLRRSVKSKMKIERCKNILKSAMLQSKQLFLPQVESDCLLESIVMDPAYKKYIAHCIEDLERSELDAISLGDSPKIQIFIGPEGDFHPDEISYLLEQGVEPVSLGRQRLRTETAAIRMVGYFDMLKK